MTNVDYLDMPNLLLKIKANNGNVICFRDKCIWLDIGTPRRLRACPDRCSSKIAKHSWVMRSAIVTGGQGFIGRYLVKALRRRGVDVRTLGREAVRRYVAHCPGRGVLGLACS